MLPSATLAQMAELVRRWFGQNQQATGPILPDGWFGGRPYDSLFSLVQVDTCDGELIIRMSGNFAGTEDISITITRPGKVSVKNSELIFEDFQKATIRWNFGGAGYRVKTYAVGEIRLAPPGV